MSKQIRKPLSLALGTAVVATLGATSIANANEGAGLFAMDQLDSGYLVAGNEEGSCGEGKCGEDKMDEGSCGDMKGKGDEGSCGEKKGDEGSCGEKKSGEGSCGSA